MAQKKDIQKPLGGLNTDDNPAILPPGDYPDALNMRVSSSDEQHGVGPAETLQGEIELLMGVSGQVLYYGSAIGADFIYKGYEEVVIGTQTWMKKNWSAAYPGSKVYDDDEDNRQIYGGLYKWADAVDPNFAPDGWRIPTEADIDVLLAYLGGAIIAGALMKEVGNDHWTNPNTGADDSSGFRALPGGKFDEAFDLLGSNGLFWLQDEGEPIAPVAIAASSKTVITFMANWLTLEKIDGYYLDVATDAAFTLLVAGYNNLDVGKVTNYLVEGLDSEITYYYRVRAYNEIGSSPNSNVVSIITYRGFVDWFLPSIFELSEMKDELYDSGVGGFVGHYWSSTENAAASARSLDFLTDTDTVDNKGNTRKVRACRSFLDVIGAYALRDVGPAGGLIFYVDGAGTTYYEAAPSDQSASQAYSNIVAVAIGLAAQGSAIGTGAGNTLAIIAQPGHTDSAAKLCNDLIVNA